MTTSANRSDPTLRLVAFDPATETLTQDSDLPVVALRLLRWPEGLQSGVVPHCVVF